MGLMVKRTSVTLDREEESVLAALSRGGPERDALISLAERSELAVNSEAAIIRALLRVGAHAVRERALEQAYAEMIEEDRENRAERRDLARRRATRDADRD